MVAALSHFHQLQSSQYPHHSVVIDALREGEISIKLTPTAHIAPEQPSHLQQECSIKAMQRGPPLSQPNFFPQGTRVCTSDMLTLAM
jgi:hypothetical protein